MSLTPSAVQNAKPKAKPYKLADERGMFVLVQPSGAKYWRLKYRRPDTRKENLLSLGTFPDVSLRQARERRDEARKLLADGIDPGAIRISARAAEAATFEAVAREWFAKFSPQWAKGHADKIIRRLPERRKMMQAWSDFLESLRETPGKVVSIKRKSG